jgi:hypothetical protein
MVSQRVKQHAGIKYFNYTHTINHLSIGKKMDINSAISRYGPKVRNTLNPLANKQVTAVVQLEDPNTCMHASYYLNIVPSLFSGSFFRNFYAYQFTSTYQTQYIDHDPALYFK